MKRPCGVMCAGPGSAFPQTPEGALTRTASPGPRVIQLEIHKKKRSENPPAPPRGKAEPSNPGCRGEIKANSRKYFDLEGDKNGTCQRLRKMEDCVRNVQLEIIL